MTAARPFPRRILVVMLADAGDLLLALPALRALRATYPTAHITLLCKPQWRVVLQGQGVIDTTLSVDKHLLDNPHHLLHPAALRAALEVAGRLLRQPFDTTLVLHHLTTRWGALKYAALCGLSRAPQRIGLVAPRHHRGFFLTNAVPDGGFDQRHQAAYWMDVVQTMGARAVPLPMAAFYTVSVEAHQAAADLLDRQGLATTRLLVLAPGSGGFSTARRWAPARFAELAEHLRKTHGLTPVIVGGPDEGQIATDIVRRMAVPALSLVGQTPWPTLAALLQRAQLVVANDSGVGHLAAAVGAPLISIFGPSNPVAWHPIPTERTRLLRTPLACAPCFYVGHSLGTPAGCPDRPCLRLVTVPMAAAACADLLQQSAQAGQMI